MPNTYDPAVPLVPGVDQAASHVFVSDDSPDGGFQWLHRVLDIQSLLATKDHTQALADLKRAMTDPDKRIRDYAFGALADQWAEVEGQDRLFDALRAGDDVVFGSISEVYPSIDKPKSIHTGNVLVGSAVWWRGSGKPSPKPRFLYEYVYQKVGVSLNANGLYAWPPIEALDERSMLICIFKPSAVDEHGLRSAELVWSVSSESDPIAEATRKVIALDSERAAPDWTQKLAAGLKDSRPLVRQYSISAVAHDIAQKNPGEAMSMLTEHLVGSAEIYAGRTETSSTIKEVEALANPKDSVVTAKAIRALSIAAGAMKNSIWVRRGALHSLALMVERPGAPSPASMLTEQEMANVRSGLDNPIAPENEWAKDKASVLKWLSERTPAK